MSSSTFTQILFGSLLDSPAIVEVTARVLEKAMPIIREHFTFTADEISRAYQESCRYSFVAISIGLDAPDSLLKKVRYPKITREFAKQIEENYFKPFSEQNEVQSASFVKPLQKWAKKTDKLFEIKEITEDDLSELIGHRKNLAISDLILAQMAQIEPVDETLAAFLRFNSLLGDSVLFFFREQFRKDARIRATQMALQQEHLCIDVKNIQATLDDLKSTQKKYPFLSEIAQQVQHLEDWQVQHEQLLGFQNRFADQLDEVLDWAGDVYTSLNGIQEDVAETKKAVVKTYDLAAEINRKLDEFFTTQPQELSAQRTHNERLRKEQEANCQAEEKQQIKNDDEDEEYWQLACEAKEKIFYQNYLLTGSNTVKKNEAKRRLLLRLSPLNPLDYLRLLWWVLVMPQNLKAYREIFSEWDDEYINKWLISTLVWLPLLIATLALGLEMLPLPLTADALMQMHNLGLALGFKWSVPPTEVKLSQVYLLISIMLGLFGFVATLVISPFPREDWLLLFWIFVMAITTVIMINDIAISIVISMAVCMITAMVIGLEPPLEGSSYAAIWVAFGVVIGVVIDVAFDMAVGIVFFVVVSIMSGVIFVVTYIILAILGIHHNRKIWLLLLTITDVMIGNIATFMASSVWVGIAITVAVPVVVFGVMIGMYTIGIVVKNSLKTGTPSWIGRLAFFLLVTSHMFLIYYCFLGGWRLFV